MSGYPNTEPLVRGDYVRNVHPCGRYDDTGLVLQYEADYPHAPSVTVQTGRGGTCYGPAANWVPCNQRPEWLARLEAERA